MKWISIDQRQICRYKYIDKQNGCFGNDDCGEDDNVVVYNKDDDNFGGNGDCGYDDDVVVVDDEDDARSCN